MTTTSLKLIALVAMTFDHISIYISGAPTVFRIIGRLAMPLYLFCAISSYNYTSNKFKFLQRLYVSGLIMAVVNTIINRICPVETLITQNAFVKLFSSIFTIHLLSQKGKKNNALIWYYGINFLLSILLLLNAELHIMPISFTQVVIALTGNPFLSEGGFLIIILSILMWKFWAQPRLFSGVFIIFSLSQFCLSRFPVIYLTLGHILKCSCDIDPIIYILEQMSGLPLFPGDTNYFTYQGIVQLFCLPLMLNYNEKRGYNLKYLFYLYYPLHIYVLFFISRFY